MTFTEEDAMNDGKIRSETEPEMVKVASSNSPRIFQHFEQVCGAMDQDPKSVLGNMLVRALNNEEYAQMILETDIDMGVLSSEELMLSDIELLDQIAEKFDLKPGDKKHPVERILDRRLEAAGGTPLDSVRDIGEEYLNGDRSAAEVQAELDAVRKEIRNLSKQLEEEEGISGDSNTSEVQGGQEVGEKRSVDDVFADLDNEEVEVDEEPLPEDNEGIVIEDDEDESSGGSSVEEGDVSVDDEDGDDVDERDMDITTNDDVELADDQEEVEEE